MYFYSQGMDVMVWLGYFGFGGKICRCIKLMDLLFRLIWVDQFEQFQKLQNVLLFCKGL